MVSYLNDAWTPSNGCKKCQKARENIPKGDALPEIQLSLMVGDTTPFLEHWLARMEALTYPKDKLNVFMHNEVTTR